MSNLLDVRVEADLPTSSIFKAGSLTTWDSFTMEPYHLLFADSSRHFAGRIIGTTTWEWRVDRGTGGTRLELKEEITDWVLITQSLAQNFNFFFFFSSGGVVRSLSEHPTWVNGQIVAIFSPTLAS